MPKRDTVEQCYYCRRPVARGEAEQDHFPLPERHGGEQTVWACKGCHSLKDRIGLSRIEMFAYIAEEWETWPTSARIFVARVAALFLDMEKAHEQSSS